MVKCPVTKDYLKSKKYIIKIYHDPNHKKLNILESVEKQGEWNYKLDINTKKILHYDE